MMEIIIFILGMAVGGAIIHAILRSQKKVSIAVYSEKQQSEKQLRKEQILQMIREKKSVTNNDVEAALGVSDASATNYLSELEREGKIEQIGEHGRFVSYRLKTRG